MKAKMEKDLRYRKSFLSNELKGNVINSIINNQLIDMGLKQQIFLFKKNISSQKARIHNRCILTGRSRSYIRFFKLSRIKFKELANKGLLMGIRKSTW
jgi:ribosomal protein S14